LDGGVTRPPQGVPQTRPSKDLANGLPAKAPDGHPFPESRRHDQKKRNGHREPLSRRQAPFGGAAHARRAPVRPRGLTVKEEAGRRSGQQRVSRDLPHADAGEESRDLRNELSSPGVRERVRTEKKTVKRPVG